MVVALVDMERAFVPPQHFIRLVQVVTLYNFDLICQLDITSIKITLIKDLALIQKFPSSDSLLIFQNF